MKTPDWDDNGYRRESAEVFYSAEEVTTVASSGIEFLKARAQTGGRERSRLCTHSGQNDSLHEMLIVHARDVYVRPHKHLHKIESFHIIEGAIDVVLFDEDGVPSRLIEMGEYGSRRPFYYRLNTPVYHMLLIRSPMAVFHEVTAGPFNRSDTVWAPWSPVQDDVVAVAAYREKIARCMKNS